jgi:hypothetical protein
VDEGPELDEIYTTVTASSDKASPPTETVASPTLSSGLAQTIPSEDPNSAVDHVTTWSPQSLYSDTQIASPIKRRRTNESGSVHSYHSSISGHVPGLHGYHVVPESPSNHSLEQESNIESLLRAADLADHDFHNSAILGSPIQGGSQNYAAVSQSPESYWPGVGVQEACLMRYFIDELACWV